MFRHLRKLGLVIALALLSVRALAGDFQPVASTDKALRPKGANLTLGAALQIADAEALRNHVSLANFQPGWFRYEYLLYHYDTGDGYYAWAVIYEGKGPAAGDQFMVIVTDQTQGAQYIPGR